MVCQGEAKEHIKARCIDCVLPGAGVLYQAVCKVKGIVDAAGQTGTNNLENQRLVIAALYSAAGDS